MYGRWWAYYIVERARPAHPSSAIPVAATSNLDDTGDLWMFARLIIVLAIVFAALTCVLLAVH
ncbi:hypothetical protein BJ928_10537 [Rhizobium sp. WW_1]|jgi:hypothetical protein|nr:hypothetical protein BJ928_10537 [Rhizobium sp. WW_1]